ncbi:MAG: rhodanese-like domain-containing protein [Deltaproteobacteria bacterium]|nr:rhodanese-like domain-containing protein [Deltaproteobacteria bacterium]
MRDFLISGIRQALLVVVIGSTLGLMFNSVRTDKMPIIAPTLSDMEISIAEAEKMYREGRAIFIDARDSWSYAAMGHLPQAINIQPHDNLEPHLEELKKGAGEGKRVIAYCDGEGCRLGTEVAQALSSSGVPNVCVLHNGWTLWEKAGLPLEKSKEQK